MSYDLYSKQVDFGSIVGETFNVINVGNDEINFYTVDGKHFKMYHSQDCCESVGVEEVIGDITDLLNTRINVAEERTESDPNLEYDVGMWTFYEIRTIKGSVTLRWYGSSNGYYSIGVSFARLT